MLPFCFDPHPVNEPVSIMLISIVINAALIFMLSFYFSISALFQVNIHIPLVGLPRPSREVGYVNGIGPVSHRPFAQGNHRALQLAA